MDEAKTSVNSFAQTTDTTRNIYPVHVPDKMTLESSMEYDVSPLVLRGHVKKIAEMFAVLEPRFDEIATSTEADDSITEAVNDLCRIAADEPADADTAHEALTALATKSEDKRETPFSRLCWLTAAWLQIKTGRRLRMDGDPSWYPRHRFGGLPTALELSRTTDGLDRLLSQPAAAPAEPDPLQAADTYMELLSDITEALGRMAPPQRLCRLFELISPLLDEISWENRDFLDEPETETAEAVDSFRRIAAGEALDADAVHYHLTYFALVESEDQDPEMHVRSQAAWLAAEWLWLKEGRALRIDALIGSMPEDAEPDLAAMVNTLAWTRSRQVSMLAQYVHDEALWNRHPFRNVPAAVQELRAILAEVTAPSR